MIHPAVDFILAEAKRQKRSDKFMNAKTGYSHMQMNRFRNNASEKVSIRTVEDYLDILGYKLEVIPK